MITMLDFLTLLSGAGFVTPIEAGRKGGAMGIGWGIAIGVVVLEVDSTNTKPLTISMKNLSLSLVLVPVVVLLSACASSSPDPGVPSSMLDGQPTTGRQLDIGHAILKLPSNMPGEVSLTVEALRPDQWDHTGPLSSYEDQDGHWKSCLSNLRVSMRGQSIDFPKGMIKSLNEPHWVSARAVGKKLFIIIEGLDGAASYRAIFTIENSRITQRLVACGEFSHEIWERTQYHDDFDEHPD
jgi:hypothetical protein